MPSDIEWTDETWNPIRARLRSDPSVIGWHCEHKSPGCEHCYSESRNRSGRCNLGTKLPFKPGHRKDVEIFLDEKALAKPLHWRKPRTIFVCSMTDLFGEFVTDEMIDRVFAVMALCPQHTFQVLTKRADRMRAYFAGDQLEWRIDALMDELIGQRIDPLARRSDDLRATAPDLDETWPLPNVWLGVSVEDQQRANERIPDLLATPAAVRFLSCEPLLGPVDLRMQRRSFLSPLRHFEAAVHCHNCESGSVAPWGGGPGGRACDVCEGDAFYEGGLHWIICGGESGAGARPMHPDWARSLRDQCAAAGVPFFHKQNGAWAALQSDGAGYWPTDKGGCIRLTADGRRADDGWPMQLVGKKHAGRLLDGVAHDGMPA